MRPRKPADFEELYKGAPGWDIGRPQPAFEALPLAGKVLDAGCGSAARFKTADVLDLPALGETFDTVLDCGTFHVFDDADRARYVASLHAVTEPGAEMLTTPGTLPVRLARIRRA